MVRSFELIVFFTSIL